MTFSQFLGAFWTKYSTFETTYLMSGVIIPLIFGKQSLSFGTTNFRNFWTQYPEEDPQNLIFWENIELRFPEDADVVHEIK